MRKIEKYEGYKCVNMKIAKCLLITYYYRKSPENVAISLFQLYSFNPPYIHMQKLISKIIKYKEHIVRALVFQYLQISFKKSNKGKRKKKKERCICIQQLQNKEITLIAIKRYIRAKSNKLLSFHIIDKFING